MSSKTWVGLHMANITEQEVDLLIIGGGINGTGIARDAAGRGLSVVLCEKGDLASATSSASTKLIHGGLRYLEHYEFRLVREALAEREVLLTTAPHIVRPLRFILPQSPGIRPAWLIRLGLFLYDHLGARKHLPGSGALKLTGTPFGAPLVPGFNKAFHYSDCRVDDSRLVVLNALDAAERGATILTRTRCASAQPVEGGKGWRVTLVDSEGGPPENIRARVVLNACGPWAENCLKDVIEGLRPPTMRLIRGSHIVVPNLFDHDNAYIFQNIDRRIVFAIPYERDFTLIGTTDDEFDGDLDTVSISAEEVDYLCTAMNRFFTQKIFRDDVVWSFAGVRPLLGGGRDQAEEVTRDYRLDLQKTVTGSTALSVLGGKITTYRKLAEQAMTKLGTVLDIPTESWTANTPLPGGNIKDANVAVFTDSVAQNYPWLQRDLLNRYVSAYGTRISVLLDGVSGMDDMGEIFSAGLFECEVRYLVKHEWARTADDILWRRTKLGLHANAATGALLQNWLEANASE